MINRETDRVVRILLTQALQNRVPHLCALLGSRGVEPIPLLLRPVTDHGVHQLEEGFLSERRVDVIMERAAADGAGLVLRLQLLHAPPTRLVLGASATHAREGVVVVKADRARDVLVHFQHRQTKR